MAVTLSRLVQFSPTATDATYYTVPAATKAILKQIIIANSHTADVAIYLSIVPTGGAVGVTNRIIPGTILGAGQSWFLDLTQVMVTGDFISARAGTAAVVAVTISGLLET